MHKLCSHLPLFPNSARSYSGHHLVIGMHAAAAVLLLFLSAALQRCALPYEYKFQNQLVRTGET